MICQLLPELARAASRRARHLSIEGGQTGPSSAAQRGSPATSAGTTGSRRVVAGVEGTTSEIARVPGSSRKHNEVVNYSANLQTCQPKFVELLLKKARLNDPRVF